MACLAADASRRILTIGAQSARATHRPAVLLGVVQTGASSPRRDTILNVFSGTVIVS